MPAKIKFSKKDEYETQFELDVDNGNISLANSLRRSLLSNVETYAFHDIDIIKNTSKMNDDILKHRISLIPIKYNFNDNLDDITFSLNVKGEDNSITNIYTNNLYSSDKKIYFDQEILLNILKDNEEINLIAKVVKGIGETHAKWSQICNLGYKYKEDQNKNLELKKKNNSKFYPNEKQRNYLVNKYNNPIIEFELGTNNNINIKLYIYKSILVLINKLQSIKDAIVSDNKKKIKITEYIPIKNTYDYTIYNETHTIANLLSTYCGLDASVLSSAYKIETSNINSVILFRIISNENMVPNKILLKTIEILISELTTIGNFFN